MPIESISIMYVAVGFLFVVLFCKALEIIVVRATGLIAGNKTNAINQLRIEFDALKMEIKGLKTELEVTAHSTKMAAHASLVPASPTTYQVLQDAAWSRDVGGRLIQEDTWSRVERINNTPITPVVGQSTSDDTWTRDELLGGMSITSTIDNVTSENSWTR